MGLFGTPETVNKIFSYTENVLEDICQNVHLIDPNAKMDTNILLNFVGVFSYYIAGLTKARYATEFIELFCNKYITNDIRRASEDSIQAAYTEAREWSEHLSSNGISTEGIVGVHADLLCKMNGWELTEDSCYFLTVILGNYNIEISRLYMERNL